jgi:hypothetical protein
MEFKKGDRVICIDTYSINQLILNKQYTVEVYNILTTGSAIKLVGVETTYYTYRFKLDEKYYRKEKLKQLRNGL